jgi:hypothetical protein
MVTATRVSRDVSTLQPVEIKFLHDVMKQTRRDKIHNQAI